MSAVSEIVNQLVGAAISQANYCFHFNRYVKDLETQKEKLQSKIESVVDRAKEDRKKTKTTITSVDEWLSEADSLAAKVVELEEKVKHKRMKTSCLNYCPPNLIRRYSLAKKLEEMTKEIDEHNNITFPEFSRVASLVGMNYYSSDGFLHFDSRKEAYGRLLEALKDDETHMIGLYGMGGCGKTTLAKEVGKEAEQHFGKVVLVTVSQDMKVEKIQESIASELGLELKEKEEPERAKRLFMRLTSGERFLLILDDVWVQLNFEAIGIPTGKNQKGCTILITTRQYGICTSMNCGRIISLEVLNEKEAWALFQKHVEFFDDNSDSIKGVAEEITKQCGGLPVAIAAVASTLKGKAQFEWEEALNTLKDSNILEIEEGLRSPYACLELSYNQLTNESARSLFLLCSVFPEDYEISEDLLTKIGIGLGLVEEFQSYKRARNNVRKAKNKLTDSYLLLKVDKANRVKMHDLVRDVALWIANKEGKLIKGPEKSHELEFLIMKDSRSRVRYLWLDEVDKFPHELDCPELEFLFVSTKSEHCVDLTNDFFTRMKKLRVLFLKNSYRDITCLQLPKPEHSINNLRCLILERWTLGDFSFVRSLGRLESLTLQYCCLDELPSCVIHQKKLKLLDVCRCEIGRNPYEVIGKCSQLEELYFVDNGGAEWKDQDENFANYFDKASSTTQELERYCLNLGKRPYTVHREDFSVTRSLSVDYFDTCISNETVKDLMRRAQVLALDGIHRSCKSIFPSIVQIIGGGMNDLTKLSLYKLDGIECVTNTRDDLGVVGTLPNLTHLSIESMEHLKSVCCGQPPQGHFAKLKELWISTCDSLEHIITTTDERKEIVAVNSESEYQRSLGVAFSQLKYLKIIRCNQLEDLIPVSFAHSLACLKSLTILEARKLKYVFGQSEDEDQNPNKFHIIQFSALRILDLHNLPNIISICPQNCHLTWPYLRTLELSKCPQPSILFGSSPEDLTDSEDLMKTMVTYLENLKSVSLRYHVKIDVIFSTEWFPINGLVVNSGLQSIELINLPELRHIWMSPKNFIGIQNLVELIIQKCGNLKVIFQKSVLRSIPQLKTLSIENCEELEEIFEEEENQNVSNPQLLFPHLTTIIIQHCHKLKHLFPVSTSHVLPKLETLWIEEASQLEQVFGHEEEDTRDRIRKEALKMTPPLKLLVLVKLPSLNIRGQWISELQTVRYHFVHESPKLNWTSTQDLEDLREMLRDEEGDFQNMSWRVEGLLVQLNKSIEDPSKETTNQIHRKETGVELALEEAFEHLLNSGIIHFEPKMASLNLTKSLNETTKDTDVELLGSEVPSVTETSSNNPSHISLHRTASHETELVNEISANEPRLMDQKQQLQQPLGQYEISDIQIPQLIKNVKTSVEESSTQENAGTVISPPKAFLHSVNKLEEQNVEEGNISEKRSVIGFTEASSSLKNAETVTSTSPLNTTLPKAPSYRQIKVNHTEANIDKDTETNPLTNLEDLEDDDLIRLFQSLEEDDGGQLPIPSVPILATTKDELVAKALTDLEVCLKMPLKDIASSQANSLRLHTSLNFLSRLSLEDGALSDGLKAIIHSLHQEFPSMLCSFKQAFGKINKFSVLDERDKCMKEELARRKEAALSLVSKMSETRKFMSEAQEKEARLKEHMSRLEKEIQDCEAELLCLDEQKKKSVAETKELKKEFESVKKEKAEMVEDEGKTRQQLFQVDYKWSVLCSQFQQNNIDAS
ncbi:Disease resistance protein [Senna tora]|uniref:Disease resistance protein n=1 Tax=Senna tora TaxID=362788 RepID=A0A834WW29_9FABA|nr:Disease resistance protein [Senna tora]